MVRGMVGSFRLLVKLEERLTMERCGCWWLVLSVHEEESGCGVKGRRRRCGFFTGLGPWRTPANTKMAALGGGRWEYGLQVNVVRRVDVMRGFGRVIRVYENGCRLTLLIRIIYSRRASGKATVTQV